MTYPSRTDIEQLSPEQRLRLIGDVWDTLPEEVEAITLSDEHRTLLETRLLQLEERPSETVSWDEMLAHSQRRQS